MSHARVGDLLDAGGSFGLYVDWVRVEAVGADWVVARALKEDATPVFYEGDVAELVRSYRRKPGEESPPE